MTNKSEVFSNPTVAALEFVAIVELQVSLLLMIKRIFFTAPTRFVYCTGDFWLIWTAGMDIGGYVLVASISSSITTHHLLQLS